MESPSLLKQLEEYSRTLEARVEERTQQLECEIRERQQTEATLRASEERWQLVLQGNNDGVWDWDILANQTFRSPRWYEILGYQGQDLSSDQNEWVELLHPDDRDRVLERLVAYLGQQTSQAQFSEEYRLRCKDGTYRWIQDRGQAVWDSSGHPIRMVGSNIDITERKQAEADLQQRQERLQRQQAALIRLAQVKAFYEGDWETAIQVIIQTAAQTLSVERVSVWLLAEDRTFLQCIQQYGLQVESDLVNHPVVVCIEQLPSYFQALETNEFIIADSNRNDALSQELLKHWLQPNGVKALMDVPIRSGGKTIGVICHEYLQVAHFWTVDEQNFASHLAYMLSLTLEARDRQRAEAALRMSEERWQLAIRGNSDGIWDWDLRTNQIFFSPRWKEMLGYTDAELANGLEEWIARIHPDDLDRVIAIHRAHLERETPYYTAEFRMRCKNDHYKWILSRGQALWDDSGTPIRIVGSHTDVSDRKQTEENLRLAKLSADAANRAKSEFLANMSHELRTPLTAILGLAEVLLEEVFGPLNQKQYQYVSTISESGKHLLELINDLLDLAKIESGRMELLQTTIVTQKLCDSSLSFVREQAQQKDIQLSLHISDNAEIFIADERRIKQVLINLLSNAIKFTPKGGAVSLEIEGDGANEAIHLSVRDTGIGIALEHMNRLFQPFVQLESSFSRRFEGTGLGLALVRRVIELHGGGVAVESSVGQGSCFTVTLPWKVETGMGEELQTLPSLVAMNMATRRGASLAQIPSFSTPRIPIPTFCSLPHRSVGTTSLMLKSLSGIPHPTPLILLVESNETNVTMLQDYLETQGFWVVTARNGVEAIRMAEAYKPELVLMDLQIPEMDGLSTIEYLRTPNRLPTVPILALASLVMPGDRERCLAAGANEYLKKPLSLRKLLTTITQFL